MTLTIELDPALLRRAEEQAAREGLTLARLIERSVARDLATREPRGADGPVNTAASSSAASNEADDGYKLRYEDRDGRPLPFPVIYPAPLPPLSPSPEQRGVPPLPVFGGRRHAMSTAIDWTSNASILAAADAEEDAKYLRIFRGEPAEESEDR